MALGPIEIVLIAAVLIVLGVVIGAVAAGIALILRNRRPPEN
jgi:hypothetical protein